MRRALAALLLAACGSGCLVVSFQPAYDDESIAWDDALLGSWFDKDDNTSMEVERSDWRSYRIRYAHPIEEGTLTAYLTAVGNERYLDLMPVRGEDRGSFLVPIHIALKVRLDGDTLELTPLSYRWFRQRFKARSGAGGLALVEDQKQNAVIASPTAQLRNWLRVQPHTGEMFGSTVVFARKHD
jgi:hypothetical protein